MKNFTYSHIDQEKKERELNENNLLEEIESIVEELKIEMNRQVDQR